jgi:hypothetical protein
LRCADLLRRVYDIDRRTCPNRGLGRRGPITTILDPDAIALILAAMSRRPARRQSNAVRDTLIAQDQSIRPERLNACRPTI